jgi:hypothetical protein
VFKTVHELIAVFDSVFGHIEMCDYGFVVGCHVCVMYERIYLYVFDQVLLVMQSVKDSQCMSVIRSW